MEIFAFRWIPTPSVWTRKKNPPKYWILVRSPRAPDEKIAIILGSSVASGIPATTLDSAQASCVFPGKKTEEFALP